MLKVMTMRWIRMCCLACSNLLRLILFAATYSIRVNVLMDAIRKLFARLLPRPVFCPVRMVRPCLRAARHKPLLLQHWEPAKMSNSSMRWREPIKKTSCCIITSRHIQLVKRAAWAVQVGAKLVMVNLHGVRLKHCCRARKSFLMLFVWFQKSLNPTALHPWQRFAVPLLR